MNLKRIMDVNVKAETLKENIRVNLCDHSFGDGSSDMIPKDKQNEKWINWTSSKLKTFVLQRTPMKKVKRQPTE